MRTHALPYALALLAPLALACGGGGAKESPTHDAGSVPRDGAVPADAGGDGRTMTLPDGAPVDSAAPAGDGGTPQEGGNPTGWWVPTNTTPLHYHWQLTTPFSYPRDVVAGETVYDLDGEITDPSVISSLHAMSPDIKVICYVDVGTWESKRSDAAQFPMSVLGNQDGSSSELWLDVSQQSVLLPIMKARFMNWCLAKGFDAIEPDNLDGWENDPGFPFTHAQNLAYDTAIANLGHSLGLSVGVKNLPEDTATTEPIFDWVLSEQCFQYSECTNFQNFLTAGKAVWDVEYGTMPNCTQANAMHLNAMVRDQNLVGPQASGFIYQPCVPDSQSTWP